MWATVKQIWTEAPWYVKAAVVGLVISALFLPKDVIHSFLLNLQKKRADSKIADLEQSQQASAAHVQQLEGQKNQIEAEKETVDETVDFFNTRNPSDK